MAARVLPLPKSAPKKRINRMDAQAFPVSILPVNGEISSGFSGNRYNSIIGIHRQHDGVDIPAPEGTLVKATASGVVEYSEYNANGYGNLIVVRHNDVYSTYYAHLAEIFVSPGQRISKGEKIGTVGKTGITNGSHLHFEVRQNNIPINPAKMIQIAQTIMARKKKS